MNHSIIDNYFQKDNQALSKFLIKLNQLKQWNNYLAECLSGETYLTEHCHIVNLLGNSLIALADSPHWVTRLRFYIPELLPKLRTYPGLEKVQAICCKVQPNYHPQPKKVSNTKQQIPSPQTAIILRETALKIHDEKLRTILERIASYAEKKS